MMRTRKSLLTVVLLACAFLGACTAFASYQPARLSFDVIAFGSCANQKSDQPIWEAVLASNPDVFVFLGDNVYGDTLDMEKLRGDYALLGAQEGYRRLRGATEVVATWDDHDYGSNDAGAEHPMKAESKEVFLDFFGEPEGSERRLRDGGVYTSYLYGSEERRVQLILLDTRWDRSPPGRVSAAEYAARKKVNGGPYTATRGPEARLLGEDQWAWLEQELRRPARLRVIATSIPFLQEGTGWETWENFPDERGRLLALIESTRASGVLFITGDTHHAQFSKLVGAAPYPLWEVNSSGLTENWKRVAPDKNRLGGYYADDNYGLIRIDWNKVDPEITMEIRNVANEPVMHNTIRLSELQQ